MFVSFNTFVDSNVYRYVIVCYKSKKSAIFGRLPKMV